ncbi:hypothetical protein HON59_02230 [bacterium]|nr:hypothetical protein [bacterium]MBT4894859.1 hypothetical protein [bacterium]
MNKKFTAIYKKSDKWYLAVKRCQVPFMTNNSHISHMAETETRLRRGYVGGTKDN